MGLEIFSILFLAFVGFFSCLALKWMNIIEGQWWLITMPIWGMFLVCVFIFTLVMYIEKQAKN